MKHPEIVSKLTNLQKAEILTGQTYWTLKALPELGLPSIRVADGPHGLRKKSSARRSGSGINLGLSVPATCFPPASLAACSWDEELLTEMGQAIGRECLAEEVSVLLGPGVNMKRSPLCGRNFEYYSEDPYLAGKCAAALVRGVQSTGVGTALKHFACNSQEARRMVIDEIVDQRALREIYLRAFEICVSEAQPWTVMNSYNRVNGVYSSENTHLQQEILRDEWGFDGLIMTDWGSGADRISGIKSGTDLEMPSSGKLNTEKILAALESGKLTQAELDACASRVIDLMIKSKPALETKHSFDAKAHHALAQRLAAESMVLLKNGGLLPLDKTKRLAVIGKMALSPRYQGAGSSLVNPTGLDCPLEELKKLGFEITYIEDYTKIADAVEAARAADIALVFAGLTEELEAEGYDRRDMDLPQSHNELIFAVAEANKNTAVVLFGGAPAELPWMDRVSGLLYAGLGGQGAGRALAELLSGLKNPCGKLAETYPLSLVDTPTYGNYPGGPVTAVHSESIYIGYRYYDKAKLPVRFPFGFGLSYTSFEYSDLQLSAENITDGEKLTLSFKLKNTGALPGAEVAQIYVRDCEATVFRPERELAAFKKVRLAPGEAADISMELDRRAFSFYNTETAAWVVEAGQFEISVGASSRDIRLHKSVNVSAKAVPILSHADSAPAFYSADREQMAREFDAVLGYSVPENKRDKNRPLDIYSCIDDAAHTKWGGRVGRFITWLMGRMGSGGSDSAMLTEMATQLPIRNFIAMSNSVFSPRMARGLLMILNDGEPTFKGFMLILSHAPRALWRLPGLFKEI